MKKVAIIGTGIVGAVTAYELARRGFDVTMIDKRAEGRATKAAAGMINPWTSKRRSKAWYKLANEGALYLKSLEMSLLKDGITDIGYSQKGVVHVDEEPDALQELFEKVSERKKDVPEIGDIRYLDDAELKGFFPWINEGLKGLYISGVSQLDGAKFTSALMSGAQKHGATFIEGEARLSRDNPHHVNVNNMTLDIDDIVIANGIWMPRLLDNIGINVQITTLHGEVMVIETSDVTKNMPALIGPYNLYMLPTNDTAFIVGATHNKMAMDELNPNVSVKGVQALIEKLENVAPSLLSSSITSIRAGLRPYTYNYLPLFGPLPSHAHIYLANGLGASGLSTGPIIGKSLAQMIAGETLELDITPYNIKQMID